jgi:hypothetical protein
LQGPLLERLSSAPISLDGAVPRARLNVAASSGLENTEQGIELLRYVATCALPQGTSLMVAGRELPGLLGLTPEWAGQSCSETCQRWVSACLLAHANALGNSVQISLRGDHPSLTPGSYSLANFTLQEAAFYGNVFRANQQDLGLHACWGESVIDANTGTQFLSGRLCGVPSGFCPVTSEGPCWLTIGVPVPFDLAIAACSVNNGPVGYTDCVVSDPNALAARGAQKSHQVITVYLRR